jgi:hypothetical protein
MPKSKPRLPACLLLCFSLSLASAGCQSWEEVEFTASYGFCVGYCQTVVKLDNAATGTIHFVSRQNTRPTVTKEISHPERAAALDSAIDRARAISWADHYGCPDCVDQGA